MSESCVVYLVWAPLGADPIKGFLASYGRHPAGVKHELVLLLAGGGARALVEEAGGLTEEPGVRLLPLRSPGLDLFNYRSAAEQLEHPRLCFLNSYSEILAPGWLASLETALAAPHVGLVGASGSYESPASAAPRPLKPLLKRRFAPFPNPHLRTNAFMLERELMLDLHWPRLKRKRDALAFESGRAGISAQVWARDLEVLVVGRDGRSYPQQEWPASATFRNGEQRNLLIADNRTRQYASAEPARRQELAAYAWGAAAS